MSCNPKHIAVIMDGNGRWATNRLLPRTAGHSKGVQAVKNLIKICLKYNIQVLSLFAFSTENWNRSRKEVTILMDLFNKVLKQEILKLNKKEVKLSVIGDTSRLSLPLQIAIKDAMDLTKNNTKLNLNLAISYGGKWDLLQAIKQLLLNYKQENLDLAAINEQALAKYLSMAELPDPDLLIRTGGEQRLSNFFLWQMAYTELYFTNTLWPDFGEEEFKAALDFYTSRIRKFGTVA